MFAHEAWHALIIMQVLVYHDLLGMLRHPHHAKASVYLLLCKNNKVEVGFLSIFFFVTRTILLIPVCASALPQVTPKFCKQFGNVGDVINKALSEYKQEVETQTFPGPSHTPYKITPTDVDGFANALQKMGLSDAADAAAAAAQNSEKGGEPKGNC